MYRHAPETNQTRRGEAVKKLTLQCFCLIFILPSHISVDIIENLNDFHGKQFVCQESYVRHTQTYIHTQTHYSIAL
jgi:hypothetical protein